MRDALLDDLDARQREAVTSPAAPLAVLAPAGSGKTRVLTRRIAWRVREETADPRHVVGVTFTRNAATELTHRLRAHSASPRRSLPARSTRWRWPSCGGARPSKAANRRPCSAPRPGC